MGAAQRPLASLPHLLPCTGPPAQPPLGIRRPCGGPSAGETELELGARQPRRVGAAHRAAAPSRGRARSLSVTPQPTLLTPSPSRPGARVRQTGSSQARPQGNPRPPHPQAGDTVLHAEGEGVLEAVLDVGAGGLRLPGVGEGGGRALHYAADGPEVVGLVPVEVPAQAWGREGASEGRPARPRLLGACGSYRHHHTVAPPESPIPGCWFQNHLQMSPGRGAGSPHMKPAVRAAYPALHPPGPPSHAGVPAVPGEPLTPQSPPLA